MRRRISTRLPIDQVLDENGQPMILEVPYPGRIVYAHIWRVNVGRMKLYLLDTDFDRNSEFDRQITHKALRRRLGEPHQTGISARHRRRAHAQ